MPQPDFLYTVHGLHIASNQPMPALTPAPATSRPDLRIWLGTMDTLRRRRPEVDLVGSESPAVFQLWRQSTPQGQVLIQRVNGPKLQLVAIIAATGDIAEVGWQSSSDKPPDKVERMIACYLSNAWLGMTLRLSGRLVLHGNVVDVQGQALAWLGDKGVGKSTLTAAFVAAGYPLLSDDQILPWFHADWVGVASGIMRLHLWPESLAVMGQTQDLKHFDQPFAAFPKGFLPVTPPDALPVQSALTPLRAIYILQPRRRDLTAPLIETPSAGVGFDRLYAHCLGRSVMPLTAEEQRIEFQAVGELCRRVPVYLLTLPNDLTRLHDIVQMLVDTHSHG